MKWLPVFIALFLLTKPVFAQPITIVAFNAENLFETVDDQSNPRDDTYLPLAVKNARQP